MIKTIPNLICFGGGSIKLSTISVLFNFPTIPQIFMVFSYPKMKFSLWTFSVGCSRVSANRSMFGFFRSCSVLLQFSLFLSLST